MAKYVTVVNKEDVVRSEASDYNGEVVDTQSQGSQVVAVVKFEDEAKGQSFSERLNGTVYRSEWAARENARDRATAD